jgi:rod shape-determining protein MreD
MSDFDSGVYSEPIRKKDRKAQYRWLAIAAISLAAILFRVYVPRFFSFLSYLQMPLLVTVYFALMRRSPIAGLLFGAAIGLAEDALSANPLGMYGIVKTLAGYLAAAASLRVDVERTLMRGALALFFYLFHQALYWALARTLLEQPAAFVPQVELVLAALNAAVAVPLFHLLDKLKVSD